MTRYAFSLSRLVEVSKTGQLIYKAEKDACRAFPEPQGDGLAPLEFLAEFPQYIPPKGAHLVLIRCHDWYSNKARGTCLEAPRNRESESES